MVPGEGVEPSHPLGRQILSLLRLPFRHPGLDGAGEGNRTLVASLEGWSSAIELRPQKRGCILMFLLQRVKEACAEFLKNFTLLLADHNFFLSITDTDRIFITSDKERDSNGSESANVHTNNNNPSSSFAQVGRMID